MSVCACGCVCVKQMSCSRFKEKVIKAMSVLLRIQRISFDVKEFSSASSAAADAAAPVAPLSGDPGVHVPRFPALQTGLAGLLRPEGTSSSTERVDPEWHLLRVCRQMFVVTLFPLRWMN